ncbi:MAG TPA: dienelactone hydrolase family protein [Burkholderiales bacterium]|nr:dienelactone hydrolase family protein [Burkholderiales bacterium]
MGKMIELTAADGHKLAAWRAEPNGKPRGALIVVQEIFGVNSHIKSIADGYAADGYLAIAPAFFDRAQRGVDLGYSPADIEVGRTFIPKLQWDNSMKDAAAALDNVKSAGKVGIVGYCWGGTVSWMGASRLAGLAAAVTYYGGGITANSGEKPKCPVMSHWGETDHAIPLEGVKKFLGEHPEVTSYVYPAGHGFNCDQRGSYDAASAKLARERSLAFLRKHIG